MKRGIRGLLGWWKMSEMFYTTTKVLHNCVHIYEIQILHINYYSFNVFKLYNSIYLIIFFHNFKINHLRIFLREFFFFFLIFILKFYLKLHWNLKYTETLFQCKIIQILQTVRLSEKNLNPLWVTNWRGREVALDNRNKKHKCK